MLVYFPRKKNFLANYGELEICPTCADNLALVQQVHLRYRYTQLTQNFKNWLKVRHFSTKRESLDKALVIYL